MEILLSALKIAITIFVPVITSILTMLASKFVEAKIQKIQDEKIKSLILEGTNLILDSMNYVQQAYVDDLKASGSFTAEAQQQALDAAKKRALKIMPDNVYYVLDSHFQDIDTYIDNVIESAIAKKKEKS